MREGYCRGCHQLRASLLSAADWILTKVAGMENFTTLKPFSLRGQEIHPESHPQVSLTPMEATQCIELGLVKPIEVSKASKAPAPAPLPDTAKK